MSCSENQSPQSNPAVPTSASGSPQIASSESSTSARTSPEASPVTNAISHQTSTQTALEQDQATSSSSSSTNTRSWGALSSVFELLSGNQLARSSRSISGSHLEDSVGYDDVLSRHMASKDDRNHTNRLKEDLSCPICQDIMKEAFITSCGHSYCHSCITKYIDANPYCPLCRTEITRSDIHPNFQPT
ncbi:uncharacterized protein BYT42DRAFT_205105 [Radiomyces spectabilis]|uniref:uncharacterized protein n=1 Tax=Radiomyces spectabilis TaxID=64574 RepID=UPI00221E83B4|nr:uncharacterized protein BYT42DRAFT_205105 [Radiomyces spectabilis]KAI8391708.1 hypothetical protein BYT42DRAFT_205105 [Radiomyces spectabilis]